MTGFSHALGKFVSDGDSSLELSSFDMYPLLRRILLSWGNFESNLSNFDSTLASADLIYLSELIVHLDLSKLLTMVCNNYIF